MGQFSVSDYVESLPQNHIPTCQHTMWNKRRWGETQIHAASIQHHLVVQTGIQRYTLLLNPRYAPNTQLSPHETDKNTINQNFINVIVTTSAIWSHQPCYGLFGSFVKHRSYLSIVLEHLIALHVVTLEHDDRSVEAGDVQTEVICPNFFIRCVWEHLGTRFLTQPMKTSEDRRYSSCCIEKM